MGKKYVVEIGRLERLYKAYVNGNGKPNITWLSPEVDLTPYTEPDLEQVRKEAYDKGYDDATAEIGSDEQAIAEKAYQRGLSDAWEAARKICLEEDDGGIPASAINDIFNIRNYRYAVKDYSASECIEKIRQYEHEKEIDGLRQNIQTIVDQCGYTLDEIAEVLRKMKENSDG